MVLAIRELKNKEVHNKMSGGGIVFGGGEPLLQSAFIHEVCRLADPEWNIRIETSLNVPWRNVEPILKDIDEWIIDIKDMDSEIYEQYTGVPIYNMLENLSRITDIVDKSKLHIRVPRIKGFNKEENVNRSVEEIRKFYKIEPEVFDYYVVPKIGGDLSGETGE